MSVSDAENPVHWDGDAANMAKALTPVMQEIEQQRQIFLAKKRSATNKTMIAVGVGAVLTIISFFITQEPAVLLFGAAGSVIVAVATWYLSGGGITKIYLDLYKREVFTRITQHLAPGMSYHPESGVSEATFEQSGLCSSRIDRYHAEDYFEGMVGKTKVIFSEVHAERRDTSTDSKGRRTHRWVTVFRGIVFLADFHKDFHGQVKIETDVAEASFGWLGRKMQGLSSGLVRLENPAFEKAFKVTATDAVEAAYLLTPVMQEKMLALREQWNSQVSFHLMNSYIYIALPKSEDWYEPSIAVSAHSTELLAQFSAQLLSVLRIVEMLDLNTRLWSKE